jgi:hypothetical protein
MRCERTTRRRLLLSVAALIVAPTLLQAQQLVPGDTIHVRLLERVRNHHRAVADVRALVIAPIAASDGRIVVPPGSLVSGHVTGGGMEHFDGKRHWLSLQLDSVAVPLEGPSGETIRSGISMRIVGIDNSRETIDSAGRIVGPPIPSIIRSKRDWAVVVLGVFHPIGALALAATLEGGRAERHRAVVLDAGTEMTAVITRGTTLARWCAWRPPPPITSGARPETIAGSSPLHAELREGHVPSDIVSIAVIGSADEVRNAFNAAGWTRAAPMSLKSNLVTFARAAKGEGYRAQPVSELVLGGRPPDDVYEKVGDTFLKRHHFRVWRWPVDGSRNDSTALWLVAATHDTGLMFSKQRHSFTHVVDPRIDLERDKIVGDLVAANHVAATSYVSRAAPQDGATVNGGRAAVITDWRMAVVVLKAP